MPKHFPVLTFSEALRDRTLFERFAFTFQQILFCRVLSSWSFWQIVCTPQHQDILTNFPSERAGILTLSVHFSHAKFFVEWLHLD
eukprot:23049_5